MKRFWWLFVAVGFMAVLHFLFVPFNLWVFLIGLAVAVFGAALQLRLTSEEEEKAKQNRIEILRNQGLSESEIDKAINPVLDSDLSEQELQEKYAIKCPKCTSRNLTYLENKKVNVGRAVVGTAVAGPAGMVVGGLTGKKKGYYKCLNCGNEFQIK